MTHTLCASSSQWSSNVSAGIPLDFYRQGTRGAHASAAASAEAWQCVSVTCPSCDARYLASVSRRSLTHDAAAVLAYPDVAGQMLLAERTLAGECPDHGFRLRVRAFTVVG
jgi:hypothetical protein